MGKGTLLQPGHWQTSSRSRCQYSCLRSQELGKGSRCHDLETQAEQHVLSGSNTIGEEKITSKSFLAVSEIKPGPLGSANEPRTSCHPKYTVTAKTSGMKCSISPETFPLLADSWLSRRSHELSHLQQVTGNSTWFITVRLLSIAVFITKGKANSSLAVNLHHGTEENASFDL